MPPPDHHLPVSLKPGQLATTGDTHLVPALIADAGAPAAWRYIEFFSANIRNANTRRAYARARSEFFAWCEDRGLTLTTIRPIDVATYIEALQKTHSAPGVKQQLAAVRMLFDWLITGQVVPINPASAMRGPKHVVKRGKTPVLTADQARALLDSIDTSTLVGLRDRALIGIMTYAFARIGAVVAMRVEDYFANGKRWWVRLHEKGGKRIEMPAHHKLEGFLDEYIRAAGFGDEAKSPLFRSARGRTGELNGEAIHRIDAYRMITRRAAELGMKVKIGCHTFRATGITAYLEAGGTLENAQAHGAHESPRTTNFMIVPVMKLRSMRSNESRFSAQSRD